VVSARSGGWAGGVRGDPRICRRPGGAAAGGKLSAADLECNAIAPHTFMLPLNLERTMTELHWSDAEDVGFELFEKFPKIDPLTVRFTELRRMVIELKNFDDDVQASTEAKLEAIQMAWHDEWKDNQKDSA
jgi:FeS assembly protein IscX